MNKVHIKKADAKIFPGVGKIVVNDVCVDIDVYRNGLMQHLRKLEEALKLGKSDGSLSSPGYHKVLRVKDLLVRSLVSLDGIKKFQRDIITSLNREESND